MSIKIVKTVAFCRNASGEAEFQFAAIRLSEEEYSLGMHYDILSEYVEGQGYQVIETFDEFESASKGVPDLSQFLTVAVPQFDDSLLLQS